MARIAVRARGGTVAGYVIVDGDDLDLAALAWHFTGAYAKNTPPRDPVTNKQTQVAMHTMILERMGFAFGTYQVCDHINRNPRDNRRANLRATTQRVNANNVDKAKIIGRPRTLPEPEVRACRHCGTAFIPRRKSPGRIYCKAACQRAVALKVTSERQRERSLKRWEGVRHE